ncbi:hypothetical protein UCRPC4_g02315 [Phaeomoniella chlamydospora]|uniref:Uncharacterized protein n=1 Tax=Phaeomoniella chlamydospora TaxID=158046 RepID=A0A0G2H804_PHACM|nr:hypothetical protein UCRPC4_g02315 [Phaeomoniella chlamydospora]
MYVDTSTDVGDPTYNCHPFAGYYLPYPDAKYEGLVTTISEEIPMLNWTYVDKDTYNVRYGVRADAQSHLTGPWNCTRQDRRMTFESWEGFVAVEEEENLWAVRFDRDDNGLRGKVSGKRVLEIELTRREKRWKRDVTARHEDQSTIHTETDNPKSIPDIDNAQEEAAHEDMDSDGSTLGGSVPDLSLLDKLNIQENVDNSPPIEESPDEEDSATRVGHPPHDSSRPNSLSLDNLPNNLVD